jgi:hypothetical protein
MPNYPDLRLQGPPKDGDIEVWDGNVGAWALTQQFNTSYPQSVVASNVTVTTTASAAIATSPVFITNGIGVLISGTIYLSVISPNATAIQVACYQMPASTIVSALQMSVIPTQTLLVPFSFLDLSAYAVNNLTAQYELAVDFLGATGNSTVAYVVMTVQSVQ